MQREGLAWSFQHQQAQICELQEALGSLRRDQCVQEPEGPDHFAHEDEPEADEETLVLEPHPDLARVTRLV